MTKQEIQAQKAKTKTSKKTVQTTKKAENATDTKATKAKTTPKDVTPQQAVEQIFANFLSNDPTLEFSIAWATIAPVYHQVLRRVAKTIRQDGFRPGKVPESIALERINQQYLIQEVMNKVANDAFQAALKESGKELFAEPELVVRRADQDSDWLVVAHLPQKPTIKLPDYQKFLKEHKKEQLKIIQAEQEKQQKAAAASEKKAKKEEKNTEKAPSATLSDEEINSRATDGALRALVEELHPAISAILVRRSATRQLDDLAAQLRQYQLTISDYLKQLKISETELTQQYMLQSLHNLQLEFVLDALMVAEKVTVTPAELDKKITELLPDVTDEEEKKRQLEEPSVHDYVELMAKRQKLADWLLKL